MSVSKLMPLNRILSLLACTGMLMHSMAALADNSAPASNGSTTTGYSLDPSLDLSPGALQTRAFEAEASGGYIHNSASGEGATLRANVRVPLHLWGSQSEHHIRGFLVEPGVEARMDVINGERRRTTIEAKGAALFRLQGSNTHATEADKAALNQRLQAIEKPLFEIATKYGNKMAAAPGHPLNQEFSRQAAAEIEKVLRTDPKIIEAIEREYGGYDFRLDTEVSAVAQGMANIIQNYANEGKIPTGKTINQHAMETAFAAERSEVDSTAEVIIGRASYLNHEDKDAKTRQHGVKLVPFETSFAGAFRIAKHVNVDMCMGLVPLAYLAGESEGRPHTSASAEGCVGVTVGEAPTVRNTLGATARYALDGADLIDDRGTNGWSLQSTTVVEKKLGPVTPQLIHIYEREQNTGMPTVESHAAMVGVSITP